MRKHHDRYLSGGFLGLDQQRTSCVSDDKVISDGDVVMIANRDVYGVSVPGWPTSQTSSDGVSELTGTVVAWR